MKAKGGCQVWDWKSGDIETKLVKMGLEEPVLRSSDPKLPAAEPDKRLPGGVLARPFLN